MHKGIPALLLVSLLLAPGQIQANPTARLQGILGLDSPDYTDFDPEEYADSHEYAPFSPADSDLGVQEILRPTPDRAPVRIDVTNELLWTNNAPSPAPATDEEALIWIGRASLGWRPRIAGPWFADLGLSQEVLRFDDSGAIDFENLDTRAGALASLPDLDDLTIFGRFEFQRLTTGSISEGDYHAQRFRIGARKVLWANARQEITAGLDAAFDVETKPAILERNEYSLDLAYRYRISPELQARAYCRTSYFDYDAGGRRDWAWNPGVDLVWTFSNSGRLFASVYFSENDSNSPFGFNDYESWTTGLGLGLNFKF